MDAGGRATQEQLPDAWRPRRQGRLLFGEFLLARQEKVTRSPQVSGSCASNKKSKIKMDSSFRWNDEPDV
jgi:hypothetical protein